jgi:imidazole glycerol-phosphate synthase subunit HisH
MTVPIVTIIDYGLGNIRSVSSAIEYLGAKVEIVSNPEKISKSKILILPGVGSFKKGMENLRNSGADQAILNAVSNKKTKLLGICMGMQLLSEYGSEDGGSYGLGLIPNYVERFDENFSKEYKIPHVGFNKVSFSDNKGLFKGFSQSCDFYFTHSYRMLLGDIAQRHATCEYGENFLAAFQFNNICGTQFHPEKSQTNGLLLLHNFLQM